jgi:hypothetical protein
LQRIDRKGNGLLFLLKSKTDIRLRFRRDRTLRPVSL